MKLRLLPPGLYRRGLVFFWIAIVVNSLAGVTASSQEPITRGQEHSHLRRHPDSPLEEARFRLLQESGGSMVVTREAVVDALEAFNVAIKSAMLNKNRTVAGVPVRKATDQENQLSSAEIEKSKWEPLGKNGIGGRTRSIVIDGNKKTIWIGAVGGGIWRSDDSGQMFKNLDDKLASLAISCMTQDSEGFVYAGTGEVFASDGIKGIGILWSLDGKNFVPINSTKNSSNFEYVNRLAAAPTPSKTLLAATTKGIFRSTDEQKRDDWAATSLTASIADVKFSPDGKTAVAGGYGLNPDNTWIDDGSVNSYYSTDDGRTWSPSTHSKPWIGRVELAFAKMDSNIVYASVDNNSGELWVSKDAGKSFEKQPAKAPSGDPAYFLGDQGDLQYDQGTYANAVWAGAKDPQIVIVGGLDLWISKDGGKTLKPISDWNDPTSAHADQHAVVAVPGYEKAGGSLFVANDGGIFEAPDISKLDSKPPYYKGWQNRNATYKVTQFYSGAVSPKTQTIIGGTQDNGMVRIDSQTLTWSKSEKNGGGDGGQSAVSRAGIFYGEYTNLNIHRSLDDGKSYIYISGQYWDPCFVNSDHSTGAYRWKGQPFAIPDAENDGDALFIAPFIVDTSSDKRIYAAGRRLWMTDNADAVNEPNDIAQNCSNAIPKPQVHLTGPTWSIVRPSVGTGNKNLISAVALSSDKQPTIWIGYVNGDIYKTMGGTVQSPTWSEALNKNVAGWPNRYCMSITVDPHDSNTIYVTFGGYESDNVWKTTNGGSDWASIGKSLPKAPMRSLTLHPSHYSYVYLGTEIGLFASENGGQSWSPTYAGPTNEGPTNAPVDQLFWNGNLLIAATHGRGMWKIQLP
jgi:hypothetical protein